MKNNTLIIFIVIGFLLIIASYQFFEKTLAFSFNKIVKNLQISFFIKKNFFFKYCFNDFGH